MVLARDAATATLSESLTNVIETAQLIVISATGADQHARLTNARAHQRNELVASLAARIVAAHASPVGSLAAQVTRWREIGRNVQTLV